MEDQKQPADSGKRGPQEIAVDAKRRRIDGSSSGSGEKDDQEAQGFVAKIELYGNRFTENMEKLIAKKRRDEQEESAQERAVVEDKENFLILLEEAIAVSNKSQQREALIDRIEDIQEIEKIMRWIKELSDRARGFKAAATAQVALYDQDIPWIEKTHDDLRIITYEVLEKGFNDLFKK